MKPEKVNVSSSNKSRKDTVVARTDYFYKKYSFVMEGLKNKWYLILYPGLNDERKDIQNC